MTSKQQIGPCTMTLHLDPETAKRLYGIDPALRNLWILDLIRESLRMKTFAKIPLSDVARYCFQYDKKNRNAAGEKVLSHILDSILEEELQKDCKLKADLDQTFQARKKLLEEKRLNELIKELEELERERNRQYWLFTRTARGKPVEARITRRIADIENQLRRIRNVEEERREEREQRDQDDDGDGEA